MDAEVEEDVVRGKGCVELKVSEVEMCVLKVNKVAWTSEDARHVRFWMCDIGRIVVLMAKVKTWDN